MQLGDLVKKISDMTDDELLEMLRSIKHNRSVARPAHKAHIERAEKKTSRAKTKKAADLFGNLSEAERLELIKQLEEGT